ncbi:MAG: DUF2851 family protein [Prevotella sp.]|nr:DUF2851 family protein [Prevotella sp.]
MEQLLHYVWKHKLFPLTELQTTDGRAVEVLDTGLHNRDAGPDFFNAKVKIDGILWVGNVEIHGRSTDWYAHHHDEDAAYDNVVLHVVGQADAEVRTHDGRLLPQLQLGVPPTVKKNYDELMSEDRYPPCHQIVPELPLLTIHSWLSTLQTERLERKTEDIRRRVDYYNGDWEAAYFQTLARNYGFGLNADAFETWAKHIPLHSVARHRDDLFQIEAIFMGQAGMLEKESLLKRHREAALRDKYFNKLRREYRYLAHKFSLEPMDFHQFRFLLVRPTCYPHVRIAQMAHYYYDRKTSLSLLLECENLRQVRALLQTQVSPYWQSHYTFGSVSSQSKRLFSLSSLRLLVINTAVPMLFAYGRYKSDNRLCDRAYSFFEQMKAEDNIPVRRWRACGFEARNASDSQALVQLMNEYCNKKDCLRCRFGYEYLKRAKTT